MIKLTQSTVVGLSIWSVCGAYGAHGVLQCLMVYMSLTKCCDTFKTSKVL